MRAISGLVLMTAAAVTWGCSSDSATGPQPNGNTTGTTPDTTKTTIPMASDSSFLATVSGSKSASLSGPALFDNVLDAYGRDSAFALVFGVGTPSGAIVFLRGMPGAPAVGTYNLYPDTATALPSATDIFGVGVLGPTGCGSSCQPTDVIGETGGTITITSVTATRVVGTFSFSGFDVPVSNSGERLPVTVSGSFDAALGPNLSDGGTVIGSGGGGGGCGVTVKCAVAVPPHTFSWR